jgi:hypothetical protein
MSFFNPQNPGIGGIDELTTSEEIFLTTFAGLPFNEGDILKIVSGSPAWVPPSSSGSTAVEIPSGTVDGSNDTFTVTHIPLFIIVDGIAKFPTLHYTYSSGNITIIDDAPPTQYIRSIYST